MDRFYLTARGLTVGYDGVPLMRDIDIKVTRGEIVTLIGPNGSGKSTILKSITRQLRTLGGTVTLDGCTLSGLSDRELSTRMAVVLTERMRPELMTCRDIVATGRYPYTGRLGILSTQDDAKVEQAMRAVQALDLSDRDFNAISDGQRQRVLLARALCQEPEIIVLDEPTSFLDIHHKLQLLDILRRMAKKQGITVVMSLHEIDLAQKISDRIICVRGDHVLTSGRPEEVLREAAVRELYGLEAGSYDPAFGSIELPRVEGEPEAFVLSACGTGIPVYRALQRQGIPFAAGILYQNDVDWTLARRLAVETVTEAPFMPISDGAYQRALFLLERCPRVIDAGVTLGQTNRRMADLLECARRHPGYESCQL